MNEQVTDAAGEQLWFMDGIVTVHVGQEEHGARASVLEHRLAGGFSPPRHVHHDEDETFTVLEGRFRFEADGDVREVGPGEVVHIPAGVPHSFRVLSEGGGRCLTVTHGGFEAMIRQASRPAMPGDMPRLACPGPVKRAALATASARNGITILGPGLA